MRSAPRAVVAADAEALAREVAERIAQLARASVESRGRFTLALSGGGTPLPTYRLLAHAFADRIPWADVHVFWSDERCVPPEHPDSNFGAAFSSLLSRIPVPRHHVHRILGEVDPPSAAAVAYQEVLEGFFRPYDEPPDSQSPTFDLALLGVGANGHTASLFPHAPALDERSRWALAVPDSPSPPRVPRVTLTFPVLNRSRRAFFLATGSDKREVVYRILGGRGPPSTAELPAAGIRAREELVWFLDAAAAANLPPMPRADRPSTPARAAEEGIG
jgi:6-phosphogluconolactonase